MTLPRFRGRRCAWLGASFALTLLVTGLVPGIAASAAPDDDAAQELADRYAPVVRLQIADDECDQGEHFQPTDVEAVLGDQQVALRGPWTSADLISVAPEAAELGEGLPGYFLDFPGNALRPGCTYADWSALINAEFDPTVYAHVATDATHPDQIVLQYWFFYVFNDYNNTHEGDWENIQLVFDAVSPTEALEVGPTSVGYSQHGGAERALWGDDKLEIVDETHPVVYPAAGSHANHYEQKLYLGRGSEGLGCDDTTDPQPPITPEVVLLSSDPAGLEDQPWLAFEGRWGERHDSVFNGPTGPSQKGSWTRPVQDAENSWRDDSATVPAGNLFGPNATGAFCSAVATGSNLYRATLERPWVLVLILAVVAALVWMAASRTRWTPTVTLPARRRRAWGQCVTSSVRLFLDRPSLFAASAISFLALGLAASALTGMRTLEPESGDLSAPTDQGADLWIGVAAFVLSVVTVPVYVAVIATAARVLDQLDLQRPVTLMAALRHVATRWRPLIGVTAAYLVVLTVFTLLVATIPIAIWYAVSRAYAIPAVVVEGLSARAALLRSRDLVRGRWWRHAVALAIVGGIALASGSVVGIVLLLATDIEPGLVNLAAAVVYAVALPVLSLALTYLFLSSVHDERDASLPDRATEPATPPSLAG